MNESNSNIIPFPGQGTRNMFGAPPLLYWREKRSEKARAIQLKKDLNLPGDVEQYITPVVWEKPREGSAGNVGRCNQGLDRGQAYSQGFVNDQGHVIQLLSCESMHSDSTPDFSWRSKWLTGECRHSLAMFFRWLWSPPGESGVSWQIGAVALKDDLTADAWCVADIKSAGLIRDFICERKFSDKATSFAVMQFSWYPDDAEPGLKGYRRGWIERNLKKHLLLISEWGYRSRLDFNNFVCAEADFRSYESTLSIVDADGVKMTLTEYDSIKASYDSGEL